jgi:hypothetical protein
MTNAQIAVLASLAIAFAIFLYCLNIWGKANRASMTQAEIEENERIPGDW